MASTDDESIIKIKEYVDIKVAEIDNIFQLHRDFHTKEHHYVEVALNKAEGSVREALAKSETSVKEALIKAEGSLNVRFGDIEKIRFLHDGFHEREHKFVDDALAKAAEAVNEKFKSVEGFRQTLTDQAATFARAETVDAKREDMLQRINHLEKTLGDRIIGLEKNNVQNQALRAGTGDTVRWIGWGVSAILALLALAAYLAPVVSR